LDASGESVFRKLLGAAKGALIRAAASTQTLCCLAIEKRQDRKLSLFEWSETLRAAFAVERSERHSAAVVILKVTRRK